MLPFVDVRTFTFGGIVLPAVAFKYSRTRRESSGVASPNIVGGQKLGRAKMFDFRRIALFCLEKRL